MEDQVFTERQSFRHPLFWLVYPLLFALLGLFGYAAWQQIIQHRPFGEKPAPDWVLVWCCLLMLGLITGFLTARLETRITAETIAYRWKPFQRRFTVVQWQDVRGADLFKGLSGNIGYRFTPYGTVHATGTATGLRLKMQTGKTLIIGTGRPEELRTFLEKAVGLPFS